MRLAASIGAVALAAGCSAADIPEGRFACTSAADCPDDWICRADRRCYRTDGDGMDGGTPGDGGGDAATCPSGCDDGISCTADRCVGGVCRYEPDDSACRVAAGGRCDPATGCQYETCDAESCVAGACETARCNGATCERTPACAATEMCCGAACVPAGCDDGIACTDDSCASDADVGCVHAPVDARCTEVAGGRCDATMGCQYPTCTAATCVTTECEDASCVDGACVRTPRCTAGFTCCAGRCELAGCIDADPCTTDGCGPAGCEHVPRDCGMGMCCGARCIDPWTDPANCGRCGTSCDGCCDGDCTDLDTATDCGGCDIPCAGSRYECCGRVCHDLNNPMECAACGFMCAVGQPCCDGSCGFTC